MEQSGEAMWGRGDDKGQSTWQSRVIHVSGCRICQKHSFVTAAYPAPLTPAGVDGNFILFRKTLYLLHL